MEEQLAILMADLSGYTALTETHGSTSAADLIDKYMEIVAKCLHGNSTLHERTGDEVMVVSSSPEEIMETARLILLHTSMEENFLQVHGGIHYGTVLKRGNSYFGPALNLCSRIAASAAPGTFWCSEDLVKALKDPVGYPFEPKGPYSYKNVSVSMQIWEFKNTKSSSFIDPVCKMMILDHEKATAHPEDPKLFFCSAHCLDVFVKNQSKPESISLAENQP